jgi:hypothetical protein
MRAGGVLRQIHRELTEAELERLDPDKPDANKRGARR